jgi:cytochrome P450
MTLWWRRFTAAVDGVAGLGGAFLKAKGGFGDRLKAVLTAPAGQRDALAVLRCAKPVLELDRNLVACYQANGSALVSRAVDFHDVIDRQAEFVVVYGPRMRMLTGGRDFFLGLDDGPAYRRDTEAMAAIVRPGDLAPVLAMARREAAAALEMGEIDLPPALSARIPAIMVRDYFGVDLALDALIDDATAMFHFLFSDLGADPAVTARAMAAKDRVNAAIDASVAAAGPETLLGRAVRAGAAGDPAFDADGIRANIIGIVIGAIPTLSKASVLAVDELLRRPAALADARAAAMAGDEEGVAAHLWEALRFNPVNPIVYRRTARDTMIAAGDIAADTMVLASNLSAMHDPAVVPNPARFEAGRPWELYLLWGDGLHRCWGDRINRAILPAMLTPLLARPGLRAIAQPDGAGTPFPRHYRLRYG